MSLYVQCYIKVSEHVWEELALLSPSCEFTKVCRQQINHLLQEYAEKQSIMSHPRPMLIHSFEVTNGFVFFTKFRNSEKCEEKEMDTIFFVFIINSIRIVWLY